MDVSILRFWHIYAEYAQLWVEWCKKNGVPEKQWNWERMCTGYMQSWAAERNRLENHRTYKIHLPLDIYKTVQRGYVDIETT